VARNAWESSGLTNRSQWVASKRGRPEGIWLGADIAGAAATILAR
jgi:hypothetical protein